MDVVVSWTGRSACWLQEALRDTNEAFAARLGIAVRTVASWHKSPELVPRTEMHQLLDQALEAAAPAAQKRFALLLTESTGSQAAQALRVAVAVVVRGTDVLLVCRRDDESAGIRWQFPAGVIKPGGSPASAAVRETLAETGVHCAVRQDLGGRLHPSTGVWCEYFLAEYLVGEAQNQDKIENADVMWVPRNAVPRFIPVDTIFPPILAALEESQND
ncbi:NUDIX hydrolase [Kitasatospora sp. MMS16-BH015]|uniref:NUDIX hydrolase n=1 Tax=Kitasatospora sp. MMS16-BH015 TaxID=2018025 RepID=UPI000CA35B7A|nr:NUDIX domain-containing protein [Kitasatospora sp. MMS16-BH015]AUG76106.1 NUDIX hydrolase [Kitasatospora sp. MMS16-BH015]